MATHHLGVRQAVLDPAPCHDGHSCAWGDVVVHEVLTETRQSLVENYPPMPAGRPYKPPAISEAWPLSKPPPPPLHPSPPTHYRQHVRGERRTHDGPPEAAASWQALRHKGKASAHPFRIGGASRAPGLRRTGPAVPGARHHLEVKNLTPGSSPAAPVNTLKNDIGERRGAMYRTARTHALGFAVRLQAPQGGGQRVSLDAMEVCRPAMLASAPIGSASHCDVLCNTVTYYSYAPWACVSSPWASSLRVVTPPSRPWAVAHA